MPVVPYLACLVLFAFPLVYLLTPRRHRKGLPYPPGPKRLPLLGNVLDMPSSDMWVKAVEWGQTYGICYVDTIDILKLTVIALRRPDILGEPWKAHAFLELVRQGCRPSREEINNIFIQTCSHHAA